MRSFKKNYYYYYYSLDSLIKIWSAESLGSFCGPKTGFMTLSCSKLAHKNIVQFYGICTLSPNICIVTEYMPKGSVATEIHEKRTVLTWDTRIIWVCNFLSFSGSLISGVSKVYEKKCTPSLEDHPLGGG